MDSGFYSLADGTGIPIAQGIPAPLTITPYGFSGLLDFVGIPVGQAQPAPTPPAISGFFGFFDFTGIPVAIGTGKLVPPKGHGSRAVGAVHLYAQMEQVERDRHRNRNRRYTRQVIMNHLENRLREYQWQSERNYIQQSINKKNANAFLLSEV